MRHLALPLVLAGSLAVSPAAAGDGGDGRRTLKRLPANIGRSLLAVPSADNLGPFIAGGMAASAASFFDEDARDAMTGQLEWSETLETAGGPVYSAIFVAGIFTAGRFTRPGGRFRAMGYDMLDAAVVNTAWSSVLKEIAGRERPNGQDDKSFPSGHTANAFALATVAERHYGWKVGVPAYALAGLMGVSRMNEDKHWLSDVVAGAALGLVVGRTVVRSNNRSAARLARAAWSVAPVVAHRARGVRVAVSF